jgi:VWFA-related protein
MTVMSPCRRRVVVLLLAPVCAGPLVLAQFPSPPASPVPTFGVATELVYVRFHVERKGAYLEALEKEALRVLEDGRPQAIALLDTPALRERAVPPEVTLALDVSSSVMDARLLDEALIREVFLAGLSEQTSVGLCAFGGELRCFTPPTRDVSRLLAAFPEALEFGYETRRQGTRLYASVADLSRAPASAEKAQRAVVVFSDGIDNRDGRVQDAITAAQDGDVRVYAVKLSQAFQDTAPDLRGALRRGGFGGGGFGANRALYDYRKLDLDRLAEETGGRAYEPATLSRQALGDILRRIATEIRTEYVVGYRPEGAATGKKRRVKVELADRSLGQIRDGERTILR